MWLLLLNDTWKQLGLPYDIIALSCVYVGLNPCVRPFGGPIETAGPSYWWPYCLPVFPIGGPIVSYWWPYCFLLVALKFPIGGFQINRQMADL